MISEYPVGSSIQKYRYVERDKVQSEISQGIMIIEADENRELCIQLSLQ